MAGLISPWNLPVYLLTFKIAPAIAAGNTVVCKPSEMTSVTAWMMAKVLNEAGRKSNISVNSFTPRSDPGKISPYNINIESSRPVMRINESIN